MTVAKYHSRCDAHRRAPQARIQDLPELGGRAQGWGSVLAGSLGALRGGRLWVVGADRPKSGKSMFVHMLLDGLAMLRRDDGGLEAPVFLVTENDTETIDGRLFSKLTGRDSLSSTVSSQDAVESSGGSDALDGHLAGMDVLMLDDPWTPRGMELANVIGNKIREWRDAPANRGARAVPVVCLDTYNSCVDLGSDSEYSATRKFVSRMKGFAVNHGVACILVSDATQSRGVSNARNIGSADAVISLQWPDDSMTATVEMNRHGAAGAMQIFKPDWQRASLAPAAEGLPIF